MSDDFHTRSRNAIDAMQAVRKAYPESFADNYIDDDPDERWGIAIDRGSPRVWLTTAPSASEAWIKAKAFLGI